MILKHRMDGLTDVRHEIMSHQRWLQQIENFNAD